MIQSNTGNPVVRPISGHAMLNVMRTCSEPIANKAREIAVARQVHIIQLGEKLSEDRSDHVEQTCLRRSGKHLFSAVENGGRTWARTKDPLIKSQLLYQLSYASIPGQF